MPVNVSCAWRTFRLRLPVHEAHQFFRTHTHLCSLPDMGLDKCLDRCFDLFRQVRPSLDKRSQFGIMAQGFVQAGGQDRIFIFRKCWLFKRLLICLKGFESPWGYSVSDTLCGDCLDKEGSFSIHGIPAQGPPQADKACSPKANSNPLGAIW